MSAVDKRNRFDEEVFSYRASKEKKVFIYWHGEPVKVLKGNAALQFIEKMAGLEHKEAQLLMAKATGNFKRGNERNATESI